MRRVQFIATVLVASGLLGAAIVQVAAMVWKVDPFRPAAILVAPDRILTVGQKSWRAVAYVAPLQGGLSVDHHVVYAQLKQNGFGMAWTGPVGLSLGELPRADSTVGFRLSPESGLAPLRSTARLFVLSPRQPVAVIDLEGVRQSGRYELQPQLADWLRGQIGQRRAVYLADIDLRQYNRLRAELQSAGWPEGPLLMWRCRLRNSERYPYGEPIGREQVAGGLQTFNVELAVLADNEDNRRAFGFLQSGQVFAWPSAPASTAP